MINTTSTTGVASREGTSSGTSPGAHLFLDVLLFVFPRSQEKPPASRPSGNQLTLSESETARGHLRRLSCLSGRRKSEVLYFGRIRYTSSLSRSGGGKR